jgi:hypothetical protein
MAMTLKEKHSHSTFRGRVVYDRKHHGFSPRDGARVARSSIGMPRYMPGQDMTVYAQQNFNSFITWAMRYNFFPLNQILDPVYVLAEHRRIANEIAYAIGGYLGKFGTEFTEMILWIRDQVDNGYILAGYDIAPYYKEAIVNAAFSVGTIYPEDVYGRR